MATTKSKQIISALYDDDDVLLKGIKDVRDKGFNVDEVYSPFPIHGLDPVMGLKRTRIAIAAFLYGVLGLTTAIAMTYGMLIVDWPMNIGGKPSFTWGENMPAFVPIMFELTVFFAAHLMVWTYFAKNGLYPGRKAQNPDPRTTDDKFLMEVDLGRGDKEELMTLLRDSGAIEISENSK
ncbi:DUF3341 domain-containing protein [Owenweeksia hongkongensis]|uniref:Quinol:cytochrome c oxidoreductase membrane protein n=1 Tax=Owenweeksia hongkongensis (strain DSM 17368 / CIP 108786 / JCM 12287 / NRRL B-23963 / UST20020801) TaxID=926562 RepID=G8R2B6_OWEHD|nr:DUF3341 domain-containing protein [Owenweeksia hongkongensis]AEV32906.1 Protein of unknown function (DUF3341) [Owenweeksia hongkongensis DSM 17368]